MLSKSKILFIFFLFSSLLSWSKTHVFQLELHGDVDPSMLRKLELALSAAKEEKSDLVLISLDTYGGGVKEADDIRNLILESEIPVWIYIDKNAGSAGSLISISCDSIYMAKASIMGATSVVNQNGELVPEKYQAFMRSKMRSTAEAKNRDPEIAEKMVGRNLNNPDSAFVLSLTSNEAVEVGYCEGIYESEKDLLDKEVDDEYATVQFQLSDIEKFIHFFLNPMVKSALILLIIGGIYFEMQTPGLGFPIVAAVVGIVLFFIPNYLYGFAEHWELVLLVVGLMLLVTEIFIIPGFGVVGISGLGIMFVALFLTLVRNDVFDFTFVSSQSLINAAGVMLVGFIGSGLFILFGTSLFIKSKWFKKLSVTETIDERAYKEESYYTENSPLENSIAIAQTDLRPGGKIKLGDQIMDAIAIYGLVNKGEKVLIKKHEFGTALVVPKDEA